MNHIIRKRAVEHLALTWILEGRWGRGWQRCTFLDSLLDIIIPDIRNAQLMHLADDWKGWQSRVVNVCNRRDTWRRSCFWDYLLPSVYAYLHCFKFFPFHRLFMSPPLFPTYCWRWSSFLASRCLVLVKASSIILNQTSRK